jgi:hypothetical protein
LTLAALGCVVVALLYSVHRGDSRTPAALGPAVDDLGVESPGGSAARESQPCRRFSGRFAPACWRPYAATSPFNSPIPADPRIAPRSQQIVKRLLGFGPVGHIEAGQAATSDDWGHPVYNSNKRDPVFTVKCTDFGGRCPLSGVHVRIPDRALPSGGKDAHMTVVDLRNGWEYDFYRVQGKPRGGGRLTVGSGGRTRLDGIGLGSDAVAAGFGSLAGLLRPEELGAGRIDHALFLVAYCDSGTHVYPAAKNGAGCSSAGLPNTDAPPMGARFQLAMSDDQIEDLDAPDWKKAVLRAMARYGMYVGDTGGSSWGLKEESGVSYTSFGRPDPWVTLAHRIDAPVDTDTGRHVLNLRKGVDWARYLRVIDPCVTRGSC